MDQKYADLRANLRIDCEKCSGLCCVALYCMKTDGFPENKESGIPCKHLMSNFKCDMHSRLASKQMKGCLSYDCFGAGQKVTQYHFSDTDWRANPGKSNEIYQTFLFTYQLYQMEWYLLESLTIVSGEPIKSEIEALITKNEQLTNQNSYRTLKLEIEEYKTKVNQVLKQVSNLHFKTFSRKSKRKDFLGKNFKRANLDGMDFSFALLIAADLEGCSLVGTSFLGADMRDTNIKNTDLNSSFYLTQMQINAAAGNANTKMPFYLNHPAYWQ